MERRCSPRRKGRIFNICQILIVLGHSDHFLIVLDHSGLQRGFFSFVMTAVAFIAPSDRCARLRSRLHVCLRLRLRLRLLVRACAFAYAFVFAFACASE